MRLSELFGGTYRQRPAEATAANHELLVRAGFIRPLAAGIYSYLPLALRTLRRIESVLREEMTRVGCQEILMPVVQPAEIWEESGRYREIGAEMARLQDRAGRPMVLAMTHEEVVTDLARHEIKSYRHLPKVVYQIQTKFRDEPRPRAGLIRVREFTMKDGYSFHADLADLDRYYPEMHRAYYRVFDRCGLPTVAVASDPGMMGGAEAHEFMAVAEVGEDTILTCASCGYAANRQVAAFRRPTVESEEPRPLERVETPSCETIADVARFLGVPESKTAKAVFFSASIAGLDTFVFAVTRGDMEVNETKLTNHLKALSLTPAPEAAIRAAGAVPGYGSPIGIRSGLVVVDELVARSPNLVTGANEAGFHLRNSNFGRDYSTPHVIDLAAAEAGFGCPVCGATLRADRAVEVGNIFKLGTKYSESMKATYLDADGKAQPIVMGCYGIGVGRLLATVVESSRDADGIIWPASIAPYDVHVVVVRADEPEVAAAAKGLLDALGAEGLEVLLDDRDESPGVKFKDADLIGIPMRFTVSPRNHAKGVVETKARRSPDRSEVPYPEAARAARRFCDAAVEELDRAADAR